MALSEHDAQLIALFGAVRKDLAVWLRDVIEGGHRHIQIMSVAENGCGIWSLIDLDRKVYCESDSYTPGIPAFPPKALS